MIHLTFHFLCSRENLETSVTKIVLQRGQIASWTEAALLALRKVAHEIVNVPDTSAWPAAITFSKSLWLHFCQYLITSITSVCVENVERQPALSHLGFCIDFFMRRLYLKRKLWTWLKASRGQCSTILLTGNPPSRQLVESHWTIMMTYLHVFVQAGVNLWPCCCRGLNHPVVPFSRLW